MDPQLIDALKQLKGVSGGTTWGELLVTVLPLFLATLAYLHRFFRPIIKGLAEAVLGREREQTVLLRLLCRKSGVTDAEIAQEMTLERLREKVAAGEVEAAGELIKLVPKQQGGAAAGSAS